MFRKRKNSKNAEAVPESLGRDRRGCARGAGYGVKAALSPSRTIDPSKIASAERGDLARVVVGDRQIPAAVQNRDQSKASGIVKKLYVDYGERVKQGQLLAELDKVQLESG